MTNKEIFSLFYDIEPVYFETVNTSHGDSDFREVFLAKDETGKSYVIKLSENDFIFQEKIEMWSRTAKEYKMAGYFCPEIFHDKSGRFPIVNYKDRSCVSGRFKFHQYITE